MFDLIRSHLVRLWKSPVYWLALLVMLPYGLSLCNSAVGDFQSGGAVTASLWGQPLCGFSLLIGFILATVFSLFFGAEYADGTMRSKLIAGHGRASIYLATLIAALAVMGLYLALSSPGILVTARLYPFGRYTPGQGALAVVTVALASAAVAAVMVCLCMLVHKRAALALALVFLVLGGIMTASAVYDELQGYAGYWTVEYVPTAPAPGELPIESYGVTDEGPTLERNVYVPPEKPPAALSFFVHVLPAAQIFCAADPERSSVTWSMPLCSLAETGLVTALGLFLFKRKDIR